MVMRLQKQEAMFEYDTVQNVKERLMQAIDAYFEK